MSSGLPAAAPHHCPVCGEEFPVAVAELRFQRHVNRCIDGLPDDEPLFPSGSTAAMMMKPLPPMSNHSGAADGEGLGGSAIPNSESQLSLESSDSSPLFSAKHAGGVGGSSGSVSSQPLKPPGSAAEFPHCASSSDFYAAIAESVEFICGLCPDFPRALVEEVLAATGNNRELALGMLFDMKDADDDVGQQQQQPEDGSSPAPRSRGGGSTSVGMHRAVSLHNFGITSHFSKATIGHHHKPAPHRAAAAVSAPPPPPKSSLVELVVYDLQPDSKMAKKVGLGVYHSGVVVYKHEFSFGGTRNPKRDSGKPGIWATRHLYTTAPVVKKRVVLGETFYTPKEIEAIIKEWGSTEWRVDDYHLLSKNCNHFADAFLQRLADKSVAAAAAAAPTETPTSAKGSVSSATMIDVPFSPSQSQSAEPSAAKPTTSSGGPASQTNVPSGVTPLPKFAPPPVARSAEQSPAAPMMMSPSSSAFSASCPTFPLPPDELRRAKEVFRLPSWVNRAASLGSAVIPDFLFKRIVEALMPPVPEDEEEGGSESAAEATPTSTIPPRNGGSQPPNSDFSGGAHVSVRAVNNEDVQTLKDVLGLTDDGEASGLLQLAGGDLSRAILLATSKR